MTSLPHRRRLAIGSANLLLPLLAACASPGPPKPPSLDLAEPVTSLTAERVGDKVLLHWTTPSNTTDGLDVKGQLTAELCRETTPTRPHAACTPVTRMHVKPGPSQAADPLPADLTAGPATLLAYRVQIFNPANHSAGPSHPAFAVAGTAPPPVEHLHGAAIRGGAVIEWQPQPAASAATWVELDRTLLPSFRQPATQPKPSAPKAPFGFAADEPANVRLDTPKGQTDPGGILDHTARKTETYSYQAQRVQSISLEGHDLELRSAPSPTITVNIADTFAPQPPAGLAAIPGEAAASIDLSWEPVSDTDLAGYIVYRRAAESPAFQRLTPTPIVAPAYTDATAVAGKRYIYRVTAVDTTGNESRPGNEVEETATPNSQH